MVSKKLENAAAAAGFAMVNPDDFAREASPVEREIVKPDREAAKPAAKSWLTWDYIRLTGSKATA
ncbi:MAG: hypothetical protein KKB37_13030 [Alphaproteobacteria bacterium]|nr:hypothetical protein [Alphaproteobacteria bacterium]